MARRTDDLHYSVVVEIEDTFSSLPTDEQVRRTEAWLDSADDGEPLDLEISAAELLAEAREEAGWT